jgi:hypothetical protein
MRPRVLNVSGQLQVRDAVVSFVAVDMMYNLTLAN